MSRATLSGIWIARSLGVIEVAGAAATIDASTGAGGLMVALGFGAGLGVALATVFFAVLALGAAVLAAFGSALAATFASGADSGLAFTETDFAGVALVFDLAGADVSLDAGAEASPVIDSRSNLMTSRMRSGGVVLLGLEK